MSLINLKVKTRSKNYSIFIGSGVINKLRKILKNNLFSFKQCLLIVDNKVPKKIIKEISKQFSKKELSIYYYKASEINKNQKYVNKILYILLKKKL